MGNNNSSEEDTYSKVGYRVLGVQPNSPASQIGLVSFFDFIVSANGVPLTTLDNTFIELIKNSEDKPLPLKVYNCKCKTVRDLELVPSRSWPGEGMLGVTIRFDSYHNAEEDICHITEVDADSPAELAGLMPGTDYLLGTLEKVFKTPEILYEELRTNVNNPVDFYVYNTESDEVRTCVVMPTSDWGGEGLLGANVANGLLHALPAECCETPGRSGDGVYKATNSPFGINIGEPSTAAHIDATPIDTAKLPRPSDHAVLDVCTEQSNLVANVTALQVSAAGSGGCEPLAVASHAVVTHNVEVEQQS